MAAITAKRVFLLASNVASMSAWAHVLLIFAASGWEKLSNDEESMCLDTLRSALFLALAVSSMELVNSVLGLTRSNPLQVLLLTTVRAGTEILVTPLISCGAWQHLLTAFFWALGETVRFGCFALDAASQEAGVHARSIRYTVGPLVFPLGASGEMLMVLRAAMEGRPMLYLAAALWPAGFYPLMKRVLEQRRKHFKKLSSNDMKQD